METGSALAILAVLLLLVVPILALAKILVAHQLSMILTAAHLKQVRGKHVLVTGASRGMGRALAVLLAKNGANLTVAARQSSDLDALVQELEAVKALGVSVQVMPGDLIQHRETIQNVQAVCEVGGKFDWIFCFAGVAYPGFLIDQLSVDNNQFEAQMNSNYFTAVNVIRAAFSFAKTAAGTSTSLPSDSASSSMLENPISGVSEKEAAYLPSRIIFITSTLTFCSFVGYGSYAATRFALRGLADSLRSELLPLGISVQMYAPGNVDTDSYKLENEMKPEITKKIDGASTVSTPEQAAKAALAGVLNGRYSSTNDPMTELLRVVNSGSGPKPNPLSEPLCAGLLCFIFNFYIYFTDLDTANHFKKSKFKTA
ncbi:hypothetical protein BDR26DRAFT_871690 [Obelidium mucronatum]|nr:hypothetical protein BDR26DRAFT_871690 [Obelidium mucronatum]